ncbi:hypothetical protein CKF54_05940 [Psittacicella hinzii]|uniref:Uncharacterized protein n=1 Tax=Psittacicella hinzii TaxID=2028575 RepID=A0A3A1Y736_9GAMM|nr:hypothetical protein [Psittacicella hinzii]RIY31874.1 hypothetical protein CKF54_05940 [Psittacicella hinzii]
MEQKLPAQGYQAFQSVLDLFFECYKEEDCIPCDLKKSYAIETSQGREEFVKDFISFRDKLFARIAESIKSIYEFKDQYQEKANELFKNTKLKLHTINEIKQRVFKDLNKQSHKLGIDKKFLRNYRNKLNAYVNLLAEYPISSYGSFTNLILSKPIEVLKEDTYYKANDPKATHTEKLLALMYVYYRSGEYFEENIPELLDELDHAENLIIYSITSEEGKRVWQEKLEYVADAYNELLDAAEEFLDIFEIAYGESTPGEQLFADVRFFCYLRKLMGYTIALGILDKETIQKIEQSMK